MNLEAQVCSLELAKRLKELGVKQKSHFFWVEESRKFGAWRLLCVGDEVDYLRDKPMYVPDSETSAFTVAELLEMVPAKTYLRKDRPNEWEANVAVGGEIGATGETAANAVAAMLIRRFEIEKGLVKP